MKTEIMKQMTHITGQRFGEERALYGSVGVHLTDCSFEGAEDGESALKESKNILVERTFCDLRYPFWHDDELTVRDCEMTEKCRAPLWYSSHICIENTKMHGVKALRECRNAVMHGCDIISPEFGWNSIGVTFERCTAAGEYFMFGGGDISMRETKFKGKYSFQYIKNAVIENCELDTKDAFWHAENVTVKNCTVTGEYLAWYAKNITFDHCRIKGTQPFCYCENLTLIDCEMIDCDLSFEKSTVTATVTTPILSVKNPTAGHIRAPRIEALIMDDPHAKAVIETE